MRPSLRLSKHKTSPWIARQNRDPYVKKRTSHPEHYRSRSAFKLLEIDDQYGHFLTKPDVNAVVDLGAAPGGWNTVTFDPLNIDNVPLDAGGSSNGKGTVIAVDLLRMQPIPGVEFLQADFLAPTTMEMLRALLMKRDGNSDGLVDVVLSDMAANASGNDTRDVESSLEICSAVFEFAEQHLRTAESTGRTKGGVLLMKHFMHPTLQQFRKEKLEPSFNEVRFVKPPSSRTESREGFLLCRGYKGSHRSFNHSHVIQSDTI
ncbi:ribosomal RNA large subunit methyltransferase J [Amanita muscaria]